MRRADLLQLTDLTPVAFNSLAHRKSLPFPASRGSAAGWSEYKAADALRLELSLALAALGRGNFAAAALVRHGFNELKESATAFPEATDLACGFFQIESAARVADERGEHIETATDSHFVAGRLGDVVALAMAKAALLKGSLSTLATVNVSQRLEVMKARAALSPNGDRLIAELNQVWALNREAHPRTLSRETRGSSTLL